MSLVFQEIASVFNVYVNCKTSNNKEWEINHYNKIEKIIDTYLPSGSGINSGVSFNFDLSTSKKLIFTSSFHYMNNNGFYDGWIDFKIEIKPDLQFLYNMKIIGDFTKDKQLKDYLYDLFSECFNQQFDKQKLM